MVTRLVRAKSLLVGGTASHAGKSFVATAICRLLKRRGVKVAPFKAQNMSLNSYPCADGGEIGRAQVVQAETWPAADTARSTAVTYDLASGKSRSSEV